MSKYHARKVTINGITYDSRKEYRRHTELLLMQRTGVISDLKHQVPFELIPTQYETIERYGKNGQRLKDKQKCVERAVEYVADFTYMEDGKLVVEDVKSPATRTRDYIIKRKLLLFLRGIRIKET